MTMLMGSLLYGSGLRLMECCRLRVKDIDFERREITVRDGKGRKDRVTVLPEGLAKPLRRHLSSVHEQHESDLLGGHGTVELPDAIDRKWPRAGLEWPWQWVFPATRFYRVAETGQSAVTTCTSRCCSGPSARPPSPPGFPSACRATR